MSLRVAAALCLSRIHASCETNLGCAPPLSDLAGDRHWLWRLGSMVRGAGLQHFSYNTFDPTPCEARSLIHRHVFHDDQLLPIEKVRLAPWQAVIICAWGLFTTLRLVRG